jgi:hypothetical protein
MIPEKYLSYSLSYLSYIGFSPTIFKRVPQPRCRNLPPSAALFNIGVIKNGCIMDTIPYISKRTSLQNNKLNSLYGDSESHFFICFSRRGKTWVMVQQISSL